MRAILSPERQTSWRHFRTAVPLSFEKRLQPMDDALSGLFDDFDTGRLSRRQLLQALGLAAVGAALPVRVFGQGRCGGRAGQAACDTIPAKAPFDPTGWKTVYMDHFTMQAADYKRSAA